MLASLKLLYKLRQPYMLVTEEARTNPGPFFVLASIAHESKTPTNKMPLRAAIGFTVKSGWASAVLLNGSATAPRVVDSRKVELSDPADPDSRQPYHAGFGTARKADQHLSRLVASVKRFGRRSVTELIRHYQTLGPSLRGAGVVVGSLIDPSRIANDHIRIHAMEGQLFRSVVNDAATRNGLSCFIWRERDLHGLGAKSLKLPEEKLREMLAALGRGVGGGWRAEQKAAALAAWIVLAGRKGV